jgi:hypothetical protein
MPSSRVFLVVADDSPGMRAVRRFACRRTRSSDGQIDQIA